MATIIALTSPEMLRIENETVINGVVQTDNLILTKKDNTQINAGSVRGPQGPAGTPGTNGTNGTNGATGTAGRDGITIPSGGAIGQILTKKSATDYDTQWQNDFVLPSDFPLGFIATKVGPASGVDCVNANTLCVDLGFSAVLGRRYRASAFGSGTQVTAQGSSRLFISGANVNFDANGNLYLFWQNILPANSSSAGAADYTFMPSITGTVYVRIYGYSSAGAFRVPVNACSLTVEDIGT